MTAPIIQSAAPMKLNTTVLAATEIRLPTNIAQAVYQHSGNLFPSVIAVPGALPRVSFKTPLKDALATIGTGVLALTAFEVYMSKFSASTYAKLGATSHTKWAATAGCAYITGWSVSHGGIALADVEVIPLSSDGSTHPLTRSDGVSLPTLGSEPLLHTLGPISINGTVITGLNQLSVSLGNAITPLITDGDLYARTAALIQGNPTITGEHLDPGTLETTLGWTGVPISANIVAYWKSFDVTSQLVSVSNSVSATMALGRMVISTFSQTQSQLSKAEILITPLSSTTSHPMATSTAATAPST